MRSSFLLVLLLAGCTAQLGGPPSGGGGSGKGDGDGDGDGNGNGNGNGNGSGSGATPLVASDFLGQLGVVQCDHAFLCRSEFPTDAGVTFEDDFGNVPADCYADANAFYMPEAVEASVTAGRITYDAMAATSCLAGITFAAACAQYWQEGPSFPMSCNSSLVGAIPDGGTCTIDFDCTGVTSICNSGRCAVQPNFVARPRLRIGAR